MSSPPLQWRYGNDLDEVWIQDDRRGAITVAQLNGGADAQRHFYHSKALYHVYGLTDQAGNRIEAYESDAYGKQTVISDGADGDTIVNFTANDVKRDRLGGILRCYYREVKKWVRMNK